MLILKLIGIVDDYRSGQLKTHERYNMISYIKGILTEISQGNIVVEAGNIGINIRVPITVIDELPKIGEIVKIYTYLKVSEDAFNLYGFNNRKDLDMFKQLIGVNGIGPKGALAVLSSLSPDDLRMAIISADAKTIATAPGIGSKTAQRIILDLKDKISIEDIVTQEASGLKTGTVYKASNIGAEAAEALVALGYSNLDASKAVRRVDIDESMDSEAVLKAALRFLI